VELTGSPRGQWVLDNWAEMLPKFIKVFPHEYKRVLGVPRLAEKKPMPPPAPKPEATLATTHGD
jgi:glutamate synthase (NADPH/NADH) large chain